MARLSEVIGRYVAPPGAAPPAEDGIGEGDEAGEELEEEGELEEEEEEQELEVFYQGGAKVQEETLVAAAVPPDATDAPLPPGDQLEAPPPDQPPRGFAVFINAPELLGMQQALALYLPYISPISPLDLPCISRAARHAAGPLPANL